MTTIPTNRYTVSTPRVRRELEAPPEPVAVEDDDAPELPLRSAPVIAPTSSEPRTFTEIRAARSEVVVPVSPVMARLVPSWLPIALAVGIGLLVITLVALFSFKPTTREEMAVVATTMATPGAIAPTPNPVDPSIPLRERYALGGAAQPVATSVGGTAGMNEVSSGDAVLTLSDDGSAEISIPPDSACIPSWSSPPPSWPAGSVQANFTKERNGCLSTTSDLRASGWYQQTNWVLFIRAKPGTNGDTADTVEMVWSDVTWFGHVITDVYNLPEAKSGVIHDLAPPPTPTPGPATAVPPPPVYQPAPQIQVEQPAPPVVPTEPPPPPPTATEPNGGTKPGGSKPTARPAERVKTYKH